jgi:hypothetical protein
MSTHIKIYRTLSTYNNNNNIPLISQPPKPVENYGSFSLSAAIRYPFSPLRTDPYYIQPKLSGVN